MIRVTKERHHTLTANLFFFYRKYSHISSNDNYKEQKLIIKQ